MTTTDQCRQSWPRLEWRTDDTGATGRGEGISLSIGHVIDDTGSWFALLRLGPVTYQTREQPDFHAASLHIEGVMGEVRDALRDLYDEEGA